MARPCHHPGPPPAGASGRATPAWRPPHALSAGLLLVVLLATGGASAAEVWVTKHLDLPATATVREPVLELVADDGRIVAESRDCRLLEQDGDRAVCGRLRELPPGRCAVRLRLQTGDDTPPLRLTLLAELRAAPEPFDVVLVLDASDSMRRNDPLALRAAAVRQFCQLAAYSRRIRSVAVVAFRTEATVLIPRTPPADIRDVEAALRRITPGGSTDFGPPFDVAAELLADGTAPRHAVLFLSDGKPMQHYSNSHRQLAAQGCPVYTIGLTDEADAQLLTRLAAETGGEFFPAPTAAQLRPLFTRVFQLLDRPTSVLRRTVAVEDSLSLPIVLDPTMHNPLLNVLSASGAPALAADGTRLGQALPQDLLTCPLAALRLGEHELQVSGRTRVTLDLTADTDLQLGVVPLRETAPARTPVRVYAYLANADLAPENRLACELRTPDGRALALAAEPDAIGLTAWALADTRLPGIYEARVTASGRLADGSPFLRDLSVRFTRTGEADALGAVSTPAVTPGRPLAPPPATPARDLPVAAVASQPAGPGLAATFRAVPDPVTVTDLYPGTSTRATVQISLQLPTECEVRCTLASDPDAEVTLALQGRVLPNRLSPLILEARASPRAAGHTVHGELRVEAGDRTWTVPVRVDVGTPRIVAALPPPRRIRTDTEFRALSSLRVHVEPTGSCELHFESDLPGLTIAPAQVVVADTDTTAEVRLSASAPKPGTSWSGRVRVSGPGLAAVDLPFAVTVPLGPQRAPVAGLPAPATDTRWVLAVALLLLALLVAALVVAALRGSRRARFVLASALAHAAVLCLAFPNAVREAAKRLPGPLVMSLSTGSVLREESVAAEGNQPRKAPDGTPADAQTVKADAPAATTAPQDTPQSLPPTPVAPAPVQPPAALAAARPVARTAVTPEDLSPAPATGPASPRRADTPDTPTEAVATAAIKVETAGPAPVPQPQPEREFEVDRVAMATPAAVDPVEPVPSLPRPAAVAPTLVDPVETAGNRARPQPRKAATVHLESTPIEVGTVTPAALAPPTATAAETTDGRTLAVDARAATDATAGAAPAVRTLAGATPRPVLRPAEPGAGSGQAGPAVPRPRGTGAGNPPQPDTARDPLPAGATGSATVRPAAAPEGQPGDSRTLATTAGAAVARTSNAQGTPQAVGPSVARPTLQAGLADTAARPAAAPTIPARPGSRRAATGQADAGPLTPQPLPQPGSTTGAGLPVTLADGGTAAATTGRTLQPGAIAPTATPAPAGPAAVPPATSASAIRPPTAGDLRADLGVPRPGAGRPAPAAVTTAAPAPGPGPLGTPTGTGPVTLTPPGPVGRRATAGQTESPRSLAVPAVASLGPPVQAEPVGRPDAAGGHAPPAGDSSRWQRTFALLRHTGDWDCDASAMPNLAYQFEHRTGSALPFEGRTVGLDSPELRQAPFLFMSGHKDFRFSAGEVQALRGYLQAGGYLWVNDSTDVGDEAFDQAVRRELPRVLPDLAWQRLPMDHPVFGTVYPLGNGFRGYRVPPGDKYRVDYIQGAEVQGRLAVVYTRNDYGDGLEIDARAQPLMASLSGLSPADMQESSIQMGVNLVAYFLNRGRDLDARVAAQARAAAPPPVARPRPEWRGQPQVPLLPEAPPESWSMPRSWQGEQLLAATVAAAGAEPAQPGAAVCVTFDTGGKPFRSWYHEAAICRPCDGAVIGPGDTLLVDVTSRVDGGARVALAFTSATVPYIETSPVFVYPGPNRDVAFDLRQKTFKSAASGWQFTASLPADFRPLTVYVVFYPQQGAGRVEYGPLRRVTP